MKRFSLVALLLSVVLGCMPNPSGKFTTRTYKLSDFTGIQVSNVVKVVYTQGDKYEVKLTGRTDWLDLMEVTSTGGMLKVKAKKTKAFNRVKKQDRPDGSHNFILRLTAPSLQDINLSGVSAFEGKQLTMGNLNLHLDGVSKFKADAIKSNDMRLNLSGVSKVEVGSLKCKKIDANINGASKAELPDVSQSQKAVFDVSGASKIDVTAESLALEVRIVGASKGDLSFKGGNLSAYCAGASHLDTEVRCKEVEAKCYGASKIGLSGAAGRVETDKDGVASKIDTSRLNKL